MFGPIFCTELLVMPIQSEQCFYWVRERPTGQVIEGVISRSSVDALSKLFPIVKGRQLRIHCGDSEWFFFSKKRMSVIRITTARMAQIERKWDPITKTY